MEGWNAVSVDFKNAFAQAHLPKLIHLELSPGHIQANPESKDLLLKVKKSLHGDHRAANLWHCKLRETLTGPEFGFKCSNVDPCLFLCQDCIVALCIDDAISHKKEDNTIANALKKLKTHGCDFSCDGTFSSHLRIQIEKRSDNVIKLSQPGLKQLIVEVMGLQDVNPAPTPISEPLFKHEDSPPFDCSFNFH